MAYEYRIIRNAKGENILNWLEEGWEILNTYTEPQVEIHTVREEVPYVYNYTSNSGNLGGYGYNNPPPQYKNVDIPLAVPYTAFILRRTMQAKVLYGQKDE